MGKIIPVILCGGSGTRLWPLSRESFPKQYLSLNSVNNISFLQATLKRLCKLKANKPIIICNEEHRFITAEQLREIKIEPSSIILEPCARNTAPAITIAALKSLELEKDPILLILPSDHVIKNEQNFFQTINEARKYALKNKIITFGVIPRSPETGYGYIKVKENTEGGKLSHCQIENFIEKPNKYVAKKLIKDKSYFWNSGIFMFKASTIIQEIEKFYPALIKHCKESLENKNNDFDFERLDRISFEKTLSISFDKAIMEKTSEGIVFPIDSGWSDIGSWQALWDESIKDEEGNILIGDSISRFSKNSLISSQSRLTIALGVKDMIIVETHDAVLVANKNDSEKVKQIVEDLKHKNRIEGEESKKIYRPWGNYHVLFEDFGYKIKTINVNPHSSLSLQIHNKRTEHWIIVNGIAKALIGQKELTLVENESCFVPMKTKHRLSNPGDQNLKIIEIQTGSYLGEDDIVRFDDNYGRKTY